MWANEAPDCVAIDGHACLMHLDPGTRSGRMAIERLRANLAEALRVHDVAVEEIYAGLKVGDDSARVRLAQRDEEQCTHPLGATQCHRVAHVDRHHVAVSDYEVVAVSHA
jgi:hypothetical protein